jgi:hypothetical protein
MNRLEHLQQTISTWLACPEVDEVVIVDWSSTEPLRYTDLPTDCRIKIVRVEGQKHWVLTKCCNLGIRLATGDFILRLDADNLISPMFFGKHDLSCSPLFYFADRSKLLREEDIHLSGVVYAPKYMFLEVNGYNERLLTYGCDDDDLVARLASKGFASCSIDYNLIQHIPHTDELRTTNQAVDPTITGSWTCGIGPTYRSMEANRRLLAATPWTCEDRMTRWWALRSERYLVCGEALSDFPARPVPNDDIFMVYNVQGKKDRT